MKKFDCILVLFFSLTNIGTFPSAFGQSNTTGQQGAQQLLTQVEALKEQAWKFTTRGMDVSSPTVCAQAGPLWQQAYDLLKNARPSGDAFNSMLANSALHVGRCLITNHREAEAAKILERSLAGTRSDARIHLLLADLYADGKGVERDPVRALGHFMLGDDGNFDEYRGPEFSENVDLTRIRRRMAELLIESRDSVSKHDSVVSPWIQELLEQGEAKNWLRAVQLMTPNGNYYRSDLVKVQLRALSQGFVSDSEDQDALQRMRLNIGNTFLEFNTPNLPVAVYFLQASGLNEARTSLVKVDDKLPFKLVLPTGKTWSAIDAQ